MEILLIIFAVLIAIATILGLTFTALLADRVGRINRLNGEKEFLQKLVDSSSCECK
jgi:hypothetical protein